MCSNKIPSRGPVVRARDFFSKNLYYIKEKSSIVQLSCKRSPVESVFLTKPSTSYKRSNSHLREHEFKHNFQGSLHPSKVSGKVKLKLVAITYHIAPTIRMSDWLSLNV